MFKLNFILILSLTIFSFVTQAEQKEPACGSIAMGSIVGCSYMLRNGNIVSQRCPREAMEKLPYMSVKSAQIDASNIATYLVSTPDGEYRVQIDESGTPNNCELKSSVKL